MPYLKLKVADNRHRKNTSVLEEGGIRTARLGGQCDVHADQGQRSFITIVTVVRIHYKCVYNANTNFDWIMQ